MRRIIPRLAALAVVLALGVSERVVAADLSLGVDPLVIEFTAKPGASARASIVVSNAGNQVEHVIAVPIDWRTLFDGNIAVERAGAEGARSLTSGLTLSDTDFVLQPRQVRTLTLTLEVPTSKPATPASYWGGFLIEAKPLGAPGDSLGTGATVFVYDNVGQPRRHLAMRSLRLTGSGDQTRVEARLRNDGDSYLRIASHLAIQQAGRVVREFDIPMNSMFPQAERLLRQPLRGLAPGDYRVELSFDYGGETILDGVTQVRIR
ncbi:MAG: hypothetical protein DLM53_12360 [Candidatus Eremiobacter antarcticus]|nr:hypothetical protein [Candidatus Eremiobacteraeota bacterium]MBC5808871.1 hypothetical protein [Candidatus Eremiobacteraeota bacterium]PZR60445.1 MAG: hypothetical protein DLM53_12360 [Candidatus Eremiobacter sp. RRmetagenome_bin22]